MALWVCPYQSVCLSVSVCVCLSVSVCVSVCLSVCDKERIVFCGYCDRVHLRNLMGYFGKRHGNGINQATVKPVLSDYVSSGHPLFTGQLSKSRKFTQKDAVNSTSIKRSLH